MNKIKRKWIKKCGIIITLMVLLLNNTSYVVMGATRNTFEDKTYYRKKDKCKDLESESSSQTDSESEPSEPGAAQGDWLTKGSETYEYAQQVFDVFTKEYGTSGAFAAGAMGNIAMESGFYPDRSQGDGVIRFGMDSKTPPSNDGGGGGLVQFTPYSKFTESKWWAGRSGSQGWAVPNQIDALWGLEFSNRAVWLYAGNPASSYGKPAQFSSLEEWLSTDDVIKACISFQIGYERPASYHPEREALAEAANKEFNKDNVQADPSKWGLDGGSDGSGEIDGNDSDGSNDGSNVDENGCEIDSTELSSNGDIVDTAKQYVGWFYYVMDHSLGAFKDWDNPPKDAGTDCSGFIWFVLHKTGKYNVPENMGWYTKTMADDAKGEHLYLEEISKEEAGPGTIVIVNTGDGAGSNGHTAILTEQWKTNEDPINNTTKIIQQGGSSDPSVNEGTFGNSFSSLMSDPTAELVFAKAVPKK